MQLFGRSCRGALLVRKLTKGFKVFKLLRARWLEHKRVCTFGLQAAMCNGAQLKASDFWRLQAGMDCRPKQRVRAFRHLLERVRTFVQILARTSKGFALLVKVRKGFALLGICSPTPRKGSHFWRRFANGSHFCAFSGLGAKGSQVSNASGTKQIVKNRASIFVAFCLHKFIIKMQVLGRSCGGPLLVKMLSKGFEVFA